MGGLWPTSTRAAATSPRSSAVRGSQSPGRRRGAPRAGEAGRLIVPRSRRTPQVNRESLPAALQPAGIEYVHLAGLGGLRRARPDSINTAWRNASFRGYADYMQTDAFREALAALVTRARARPTAITCAESVPWRCHRSLVADALTARGVTVLHILRPERAEPHAMTRWAHVRGIEVTCPGEGPTDGES